MSDGEGCGWLTAGVALFAFGALVGARLNQEATNDWWRDELARRGHAHYYLDGENKRQWNWLPASHEKPLATEQTND